MHSKNNWLDQVKLYAYVSIAQAEVALRSKINEWRCELVQTKGGAARLQCQDVAVQYQPYLNT